MKDVSEYREELLKIARENSDVELALVATGYRSAQTYLLDIVNPKKSNVGFANVSPSYKMRIGTIVKANDKRRDQLLLWIRRETKDVEEGRGNEAYLELYKQELELLDTYALIALADLIRDKEALEEQGIKDEAEREERKRQNAVKRAALKAIEDAQAQLEAAE